MPYKDPAVGKAYKKRYTAGRRKDPEWRAYRAALAKAWRSRRDNDARARDAAYHRAYGEVNRDKKAAYLKAWVTANPDKVAGYDAARRVRQTSAPVIERVDRRVVFERDGWICQLCGEIVDPLVQWPAPMSKSIDHRVALKNGGDHSYANCQLAHLVCNHRKHAR